MASQLSHLIGKAGVVAGKFVGIVRPHAVFWGRVAWEDLSHNAQNFPRRSSEALAEAKTIVDKVKDKNFTVGEALSAGAVAIEFAAFFAVGEIIGRRSFLGYDIKKPEIKATPAH
eukprot:TRINITY_DN320_c0_g1_i1.p1 TRINITY_DN320_c0_g1~~TRINITY_DN320_c0_g1_i1.p1  ORF type:complete len:129 (-),score=29.86 TRINITY_DN320_c0_g1_i1:38-382(-)